MVTRRNVSALVSLPKAVSGFKCRNRDAWGRLVFKPRPTHDKKKEKTYSIIISMCAPLYHLGCTSRQQDRSITSPVACTSKSGWCETSRRRVLTARCTLYWSVMANTAGQWNAPVDCCGQHRRPRDRTVLREAEPGHTGSAEARGEGPRACVFVLCV